MMCQELLPLPMMNLGGLMSELRNLKTPLAWHWNQISKLPEIRGCSARSPYSQRLPRTSPVVQLYSDYQANVAAKLTEKVR